MIQETAVKDLAELHTDLELVKSKLEWLKVDFKLLYILEAKTGGIILRLDSSSPRGLASNTRSRWLHIIPARVTNYSS